MWDCELKETLPWVTFCQGVFMTEIQMKLVKGNYVYQSEAGDRDFGYIFYRTTQFIGEKVNI